ncbi:ketopantoate reductase family protein [Actinomadura barringtoniae]|uniref:Ketopantoate reductase family protein n=1 Tax=Actinomadura barringtoniae TaxID=1427535 RepID=A0A939T9W9_9ACTN|nr:2-dehydropantoate 2-reductase N-terminal domain-containing protein [Actinomadura barringtoniae]MBO2455558.1 ketopantoate reductase family protein [Actinomadura barringtoniae]
MRYVIIGAGAIGGAIGGRLHLAGHDVVLVARGAHYAALRDKGLRLTTRDGVHELTIPVVDGPESIELTHDDVLILAVKTQAATAALDAWAARPVSKAEPRRAVGAGPHPASGAGPRRAVGGGATAAEVLPLICAQNGVESERIALRRFRRVYGMCVWLPATFLVPGEITTHSAPYTGALSVGRYPSGADETVERIAADLASANFLAPVRTDVMRWKYAKLVSNLANAVEAICGSGAGVEEQTLIARARAEAVAVLDKAGIERVPADEEQALRKGRVSFGPNDGSRGGGSSWQDLRRGNGSIEVDYLTGEIVLLGRLHDVPTPVNETLQRVANEFARERRAPGSMTGAELTTLIDG